jgi:hypothetical protein
MQYEYSGWIIDATPDFSLGKFFAHVRLIRASPDSEADAEMHIARDLAWFDSEDEAVRFAHQWAIAWIDERGGGAASTQVEPPASQDDFPAGTAAEQKAGYVTLEPAASHS